VLGGSAELTSPQVRDLREGRYYVQIHSQGNPEGELRGWLFLQEAQ
jgi:hypothetical protein